MDLASSKETICVFLFVFAKHTGVHDVRGFSCGLDLELKYRSLKYHIEWKELMSSSFRKAGESSGSILLQHLSLTVSSGITFSAQKALPHL